MSKRHQPSVCVLMSVFNGEAYLEEAITSILDQSHSDFEFIIIDDGSSDDTAGIIKQWRERDSRIRRVSQSNSGLTFSLAKGVRMASAPLIARLDADDISLPERLETQIAEMHKRPALAVLGTAVKTIDHNGRIIRQRKTMTGPDQIASALLVRNQVNHSSALIRRNALLQAGNYNPKFKTSQDYDLWLRLGQIGQIDNLPQVLLYYRKHLGRISSHKNPSRQTYYSVAAICDHWLRALNLPETANPISHDAPQPVVDAIMAILNSSIKREHKQNFSRHVLRFLRHCDQLTPAQRQSLKATLAPWLNWTNRLKARISGILK